MMHRLFHNRQSRADVTFAMLFYAFCGIYQASARADEPIMEWNRISQARQQMAAAINSLEYGAAMELATGRPPKAWLKQDYTFGAEGSKFYQSITIEDVRTPHEKPIVGELTFDGTFSRLRDTPRPGFVRESQQEGGRRHFCPVVDELLSQPPCDFEAIRKARRRLSLSSNSPWTDTPSANLSLGGRFWGRNCVSRCGSGQIRATCLCCSVLIRRTATLCRRSASRRSSGGS